MPNIDTFFILFQIFFLICTMEYPQTISYKINAIHDLIALIIIQQRLKNKYK